MYTAYVSREGRWWMIHVDGIDGLTQARRLVEAERMAREFIAVSLGLPLAEVEVRTVIEEIDSVPVAVEAARIADERAEAARLEQDALKRSTELARRLAAANIPVRDIGEILGVSYQRAHQLANA